MKVKFKHQTDVVDLFAFRSWRRQKKRRIEVMVQVSRVIGPAQFSAMSRGVPNTSRIIDLCIEK